MRNDRYFLDDSDFILTRPTLTPTQVQEVQEDLSASLTAEQSYPQITADQNNFPLEPGVLQRLSTDASRTITGFANADAGIKVIMNVGAQNIVLANDSASSTLQNRILCHTGANITLNENESALLIYDFVTTKWRTVGFI